MINKDYIITNLLSKDGGINCHKTKDLNLSNIELYLILHDLSNEPVCECGSKLEFLNFKKGFRKFCSRKCTATSTNTKENIKKTKLEKYGDEYYNNKDKHKQTCLEKYGTEYYMLTEEFQNIDNKSWELSAIKNRKNTNIKKFGVDNPWKNKEIKQKARDTTFKLYGNYNNFEKIKRTCLKKYNVQYTWQIDGVYKKSRQTSILNWGVEHYAQSNLNKNSGYKSYQYELPSGNLVTLQGYEKFLLDELLEEYKESEILSKKSDMPEFWYIDNKNIKRRYFPDFFIPSTNTIYEVKSEYTLKQSKLNNIFNLKKNSVLELNYEFILKVY